ncbi:putative hydrolase YtaP [Streptomyces afghaniensis 772] [Streptomyces afghaniensis]
MGTHEPLRHRSWSRRARRCWPGERWREKAAVVDGPLPTSSGTEGRPDLPAHLGEIPDPRLPRLAARRRATVEQHLLVNGTTEQGEGYTRRKVVALSLTGYKHVRGALLTPHGKGPFPAVLLLHDHGASSTSGRRNSSSPGTTTPVSPPPRATGRSKYFSGRFVGDELARRGYVVLCLDALVRSRPPLAYDQQQALASNFYNLGSSLAGLWPGKKHGLPGGTRP